MDPLIDLIGETRMKTTVTPLAALTLLCAVPLATTSIALAGDGADWPQWRGPDRTGVSVETGWNVGIDQTVWHVLPSWTQ